MDRREKAVRNKDKAVRLNTAWGVNAVQARYSDDGHWYANLIRFPAALFDAHGYVYFATDAEYQAAPMSIGKQISIPKPGISAMPGYVRVSDHTTLDGQDAVPLTADESNDYAIENRKIEIESRQKQSVFRQRVMQNFECRCCLSEISEQELLVASHIVPWAKRIETRLDPANGLLLYCPFDRLFDRGFITFDSKLRVVVASEVSEWSSPLRAVLDQLRGQQARRPIKWAIKLECLAYHRAKVFQDGPSASRALANAVAQDA